MNSRRTKRLTFSQFLCLWVLVAESVVIGQNAFGGSVRDAPICEAVSSKGSWITIEAPTFGSDDAQSLDAFAVDPNAPGKIFVTNGIEVLRSIDGGCRWAEIYSLQIDVPEAYRSETRPLPIRSIVVSSNGFVYLLIEERYANGIRPRLDISKDGGKSWATLDTTAIAPGRPDQLLPTSQEDTLYLSVDTSRIDGGYCDNGLNGNPSPWLLYASSDAGRSWELRSNPLPPLGSRPSACVYWNDLAVDPADPNELWMAHSLGIFHSTNGGRSWASEEIEGGFGSSYMGSVDVDREGSASSTVAVLSEFAGVLKLSRDGGDNWSSFNAPDFTESMTRVSRTGFVISGWPRRRDVTENAPRFVYSLDTVRGHLKEITPGTLPKDTNYTDLTSDLSADGVAYMLAGWDNGDHFAILRYAPAT